MHAKWHPPVTITTSRTLRAELRTVGQYAGWDFEHTDSIPPARRYASRRPMIVVGADLAARVRNPLSCAGFVVVATITSSSQPLFTHAGRIGAACVVVLPGARAWLADQLLHVVTELMRHRR